MSSWVRRCVAFACLLAAWLVVRPASAAPLCDDRAASALAPLPVLDTPNASVDIGDGPNRCEGWAATDLAYQRGELPTRVFPTVRGDFVLTTIAVAVPKATPVLVPAHFDPTARRAGVRSLVERPPRR